MVVRQLQWKELTVAAGGVGEITMGALAGSVFSTTNLCAAVASNRCYDVIYMD